jgi:hypothetical protein
MRKLWVLIVFASVCCAISFSQNSPTWEFDTSKDRMNDKQFAIWGLRATDTGILSVEASLYIKCQGGHDVVWVATGTTPDAPRMKSEASGLIGTVKHGDVPITLVNLRFDSGKVIPEEWERRGAVADLYAANDKKLIRKIVDAKIMLFRFDTFTEGGVVYRFDVGGLNKYDDVLRRECKY